MRRFYRELGRRISDARRKHPDRVTQAILAQRVGVSRSSIANIEQGRQQPPVHLLILIADALNERPERLLPNLGEEGRDRAELVRALQEVDVEPEAIARVTELADLDEGDDDAEES